MNLVTEEPENGRIARELGMGQLVIANYWMDQADQDDENDEENDDEKEQEAGPETKKALSAIKNGNKEVENGTQSY